eukprot:GILJ01002445.1.p2 GENE.GILJ01002445.1~~GILJ01002445.1.p2  ORF type:complete len:174 (+),score=29.16 GILJ01002445.1:1711-2232(+)
MNNPFSKQHFHGCSLTSIFSVLYPWIFSSLTWAQVESVYEASKMVNINVTNIDISPNQCPLQEALNLAIDFEADQPIPAASWEVKYIVDTVFRRKIILLGTMDNLSYDAGANSFRFSVPGIDVGGISSDVLANAGLLVATLKDGQEEVIGVNMVTQVSKQGNELIRVIFNPLE